MTAAWGRLRCFFGRHKPGQTVMYRAASTSPIQGTIAVLFCERCYRRMSWRFVA